MGVRSSIAVPVSMEPDSMPWVIASINLLVAWTIIVGVATATKARTAITTVNGGHGAMKMRYQKTASAHRSLAALSRFFISPRCRRLSNCRTYRSHAPGVGIR